MNILSGFKLPPNSKDDWKWTLMPSGRFHTSDLTSLLNSRLLPSCSSTSETLINKMVPHKLGIFVWRARLQRLPVLMELDKRGVDLDSVRCPICNNDVETIEHTLFRCSFALDLWSRVIKWWGSSFIMISRFEDLFKGLLFSSSNSSVSSKLWQTIEWVTGYMLWRNRNQVVFKKKKESGPMLLNEIQIKSFEWISRRSRKLSLV
ncbi:uncharacterized protein [Rutidosis leptorrhynchoides]|uniref:uncharacterized protein n=1 Tax=Rutidosis leptorrhynchoides TaxID=125765 RepID=UPI003A9933DC